MGNILRSTVRNLSVMAVDHMVQGTFCEEDGMDHTAEEHHESARHIVATMATMAYPDDANMRSALQHNILREIRRIHEGSNINSAQAITCIIDDTCDLVLDEIVSVTPGRMYE